MGGFPKLGYPFGVSNKKDYSIWGSTLGSPYLGKLPYIYIYIHIPTMEKDNPEVLKFEFAGICVRTKHLALNIPCYRTTTLSTTAPKVHP